MVLQDYVQQYFVKLQFYQWILLQLVAMIKQGTVTRGIISVFYIKHRSTICSGSAEQIMPWISKFIRALSTSSRPPFKVLVDLHGLLLALLLETKIILTFCESLFVKLTIFVWFQCMLEFAWFVFIPLKTKKGPKALDYFKTFLK